MSGWHPDPPIYAAVTQDGEDRVTLVRALLAQGEDPNAPDDRGYPPLTCDGVLDDLALMDVLLEGGADPNGMSRGNRLLGDIVRGFPFQKTKEAQARLLAARPLVPRRTGWRRPPARAPLASDRPEQSRTVASQAGRSLEGSVCKRPKLAKVSLLFAPDWA